MCRSQYFQAILLVQSIAAPGQVMITSWLWLVRNLVRYLDIFGRRFQFQMSFLHCFYHHWCWQTAKCLEEKRSNHWLYTHLHWLHPHFFGLESPFLAFSRIFVGQNLESSWWFVSLLDIPMNFHEFPWISIDSLFVDSQASISACHQWHRWSWWFSTTIPTGSVHRGMRYLNCDVGIRRATDVPSLGQTCWSRLSTGWGYTNPKFMKLGSLVMLMLGKICEQIGISILTDFC